MAINTRALTLTELLIATAVVGIIMMGVMSADYAIRKQSVTASSSASANLYAQSIVTNIINNAYKATGSITDKGILIDTSLGGPDTVAAGSFCARTDTVPDWVCYTVIPALNGNLYTCPKSPTPGACALSDKNLGKIISVTPQFTLVGAVGSQQLTFTVTLTVEDQSLPSHQRSLTTSISPPGHRI